MNDRVASAEAELDAHYLRAEILSRVVQMTGVVTPAISRKVNALVKECAAAMADRRALHRETAATVLS